MGVVARGLQAEIGPLSAAAQAHSAASTPSTTATGSGQCGPEGKAAVGGAGAGSGTTHHRPTLTTATAHRLQQHRMGAVATAFAAVAGDDGQLSWGGQLNAAG